MYPPQRVCGDSRVTRRASQWGGGLCGRISPVPPAGHVLCLVVLALPVRSLVKLYLHLLTALLLAAGHGAAR